MLQTAIVIFREFIEAFLIIAIMADYLVKTERRYLLKSVAIGIASATAISLIFADIIDGIGKTELAEGVLSMIAGALVLSLTFYVIKTAKFYRKNVENVIEKAEAKQGVMKFIAVGLFAFIMVAREGFEIVLLLISISYETEKSTMYVGSAIGGISALILCYLWLKYSYLINLSKFLRATSFFLFFFAIHLFIYGFHELTEAYVLPIDNDYWHIATEDFADPESLFSKIMFSGIAIIPFAFLAFYYLRDKFFHKISN
ncbi:MAG: FTR1 family protein [Rickettsiales bacterium]|nr:FTR1 family protein [Rickettsiales bacterium]